MEVAMLGATVIEMKTRRGYQKSTRLGKRVTSAFALVLARDKNYALRSALDAFAQCILHKIVTSYSDA